LNSASFHAVQRRLAALIPEATTVVGGTALELSGLLVAERPRLDPPMVLEDEAITTRVVPGGPNVRFTAFLDGSQSSRVAQFIRGVPIVHGTVAAVVRHRQDRRMTTWRAPLVRRRLYAPLALLPARIRNALTESDSEIVDTMASREVESIHPFALQEAALQCVQRDRSALERELAESWCGEGTGDLLMDGGISESRVVARSPAVVGVVKSHQQLYVGGDDLGTILGLKAGERSSVVRIAPRARTPVASWYLRLRGGTAHDPLWGLVRIEVAELANVASKDIRARADEVSRWVLAEALPLAIPDARWDKMVYGIRDCEEFLRAIQ
jgi:hypothetical protein